jgi:hypothetical protein
MPLPMRRLFFPIVLLLINSTSWGDVLILRNGQVISGSIEGESREGTKFRRGAALNTYSDNNIVNALKTELAFTSPSRIPSLGTALNLLLALPWVREVRQIPATVIGEGVFKNVPYVSFRCASDYEINVYGDPEHPVAIEIGIYRSLLKQPGSKDNCLEYVSGLFKEGPIQQAVFSVKRTEDLIDADGHTVQVTPPEARDSQGGWWISVYAKSKLDAARASKADLSQITVPKTPPAKNPGGSAEWSSEELKFARPSAIPATPSGDESTGGAVYVRGYNRYTRPDGTYLYRRLLWKLLR